MSLCAATSPIPAWADLALASAALSCASAALTKASALSWRACSKWATDSCQCRWGPLRADPRLASPLARNCPPAPPACHAGARRAGARCRQAGRSLSAPHERGPQRCHSPLARRSGSCSHRYRPADGRSAIDHGHAALPLTPQPPASAAAHLGPGCCGWPGPCSPIRRRIPASSLSTRPAASTTAADRLISVIVCTCSAHYDCRAEEPSLSTLTCDGPFGLVCLPSTAALMHPSGRRCPGR